MRSGIKGNFDTPTKGSPVDKRYVKRVLVLH